MAVRPTLRSVGYRRVVVTGMGLVTCLGLGVQNVWKKLLDGDSGVTALSAPEYSGIPCRVAGTIPCGSNPGELDLEKFVSLSDQKTMSIATAYALVSAHEAVTQAGWIPTSDEDRCRTGVSVGMGMVGLDDIVTTGKAFSEQGYRRVSPHFVPRILTNMAAGLISLKYGFKGVNHAVSTACATGAHAVGDACRFIAHGDADVMVCGGTEASVGAVAIAGFARMRALSTKFNDRPAEASRPFDKERDGFVMSDGAGILVLEELEHARSRGATVFAEVLGYGLSGDVAHITAPSTNGDGAYRCMMGALRDAQLNSYNVGYINAHATSTPLGDAAEACAIERLFNEKLHRPSHALALVSSTKGSIGHSLGAAGAIETIFTIQSCASGLLPPTLNCDLPDIDGVQNFRLVTGRKAVKWPVHQINGITSRRIALTNSFGFGGTNASLCIGAAS